MMLPDRDTSTAAAASTAPKAAAASTAPRGADLLSATQLESDPFKIYCYKIVPCAKKFGHDWSECPFAHEGEKATRRCPALYLYSSIVCPDVRQSKPCPRGDVCPYSHSIFEYWMHPARFRAQMCSFGAECNRRICFFAHAQDQLRVPSEPIVADALASRAPYLQGRVCPKSRYALYTEQVPPAIPIAGVMQPQALLQPDLSGAGQGMPQMMLVPAGGPSGGGMGMGAAGLQPQQQQQWAQASNMVYVPAAQPGGGAGLGYYMQAGSGTGGGMAPGGMHQQQQYSSGAAGLHMGGPAGPAYTSAQPVQLVTAMGPDGNLAQYPVAAGGMPGGGMAFAPAIFAPSAPNSLSMPVQQGWGLAQSPGPPGRQQVQPRSQQGQQQMQLVQGAKPGGGLGQGGAQEGFLLPPGQSQAVEGGGYAMLAPGAAINAPVVPAHNAGAAGEAGPSRMDDLAQQMGGWRIT